MVELIEIKFKDIEMHLPESREAVTQARKLLDLFEETLDGNVKPKPKKSKPEPEKSTVSASAPDAASDEYNFKECEKFDHSNLPEHKAGKSTYWLSADQKKVCIEREGYAQGLYIHAAVDDLKYLYAHLDKVNQILKKFTPYKKYHVTGFLKDVDISTLSGEQVQAESEEPEEQPSEQSEQQHNEHSESNGDHKSKPKIEFFQEDTGFDYMAVQPKWVGRTQVYLNPNGKMVIKADREIVLTTKDTIEKLLQYNEKDLNSCIRGISRQKQNILRVYLAELKKREAK